MSLFPPDDWVTVGHSRLEAIAEMMRSRLEVEGIDAVLRGNKASGTAGVINELNISWDNPLGGVEVRVHESDAEKAREILAETQLDEDEVEESAVVADPVNQSRELKQKSGMQIYFQVFSAFLIGLWVLAGVTAWSQNPRTGLICGVVVCALFFFSAIRPRK
jgi:hypothetical protein